MQYFLHTAAALENRLPAPRCGPVNRLLSSLDSALYTMVLEDSWRRNFYCASRTTGFVLPWHPHRWYTIHNAGGLGSPIYTRHCTSVKEHHLLRRLRRFLPRVGQLLQTSVNHINTTGVPRKFAFWGVLDKKSPPPQPQPASKLTIVYATRQIGQHSSTTA